MSQGTKALKVPVGVTNQYLRLIHRHRLVVPPGTNLKVTTRYLWRALGTGCCYQPVHKVNPQVPVHLHIGTFGVDLWHVFQQWFHIKRNLASHIKLSKTCVSKFEKRGLTWFNCMSSLRKTKSAVKQYKTTNHHRSRRSQCKSDFHCTHFRILKSKSKTNDSNK